MNTSLIAQRYAKAIFDLALEMNVVEEVKDDMELIHTVCADSHDLRLMLKSPVIRPEKKMKVLEEIFGREVNEMSLRYLMIVTRKKREMYIPQIATGFIEVYKQFKNIFTVHLSSASALTDELRRKVIALLEDQTKGSIDLHEEVKKDLVGGFVLSYDDYKYDASITYQLKKLKKAAAEMNFYVREL